MKTLFFTLAVSIFLVGVSNSGKSATKRKFAWFQNKVNQAGIPMIVKKPILDGKISENEWDDAISFTGFMAPHNVNRQPYIQPKAIQPTVYAGYDAQYVYIACESPIPPSEANSSDRVKKMLNKYWKKGLKADHVKHDDFLEQDDYWMLDIVNGDDKIHKRDKTHYRLLVNPAGCFSDYRTTPKHRGTHRQLAGREWESGAIVKSVVSTTSWTVEMAIPIASLDESFRPRPGVSWRVYIRRGRGQDAYDTSACEWNAAKGWFMESQAGLFLFSKNIPAFHLENIGAPRTQNELNVRCRLVNATEEEHKVKLRVAVECVDQVLWEKTRAINLPKGKAEVIDFEKWKIAYPENHSARIVIDAEADSGLLYNASIQAKPLDQDDYSKIATIGIWPFEHPLMNHWSLRCANYPYFKSMDVWIDLSAPYLPEILRSARNCVVSLHNANTGKLIRQEKTPIDSKSLKGSLHCTNLDLPDGNYQLRGDLFDQDGQKIGETVTHDFVRKKFPWEHNQIGVSDKVYPPFTAMKTNIPQKTIQLWGKTYTIGDCGLPGKIESTDEMGIPPLTIFEGVSLEVERQGRRSIFKGASQITSAKPGIVTATGTGNAEGLDLKVDSAIRYEGWYEVEMTVTPSTPTLIDNLKLTFSYGKYPDVFWLTWDRAKTFISGIPKTEGTIWKNINPTSRDKDCFFVPVVALGNGDASLWWYANSDESWKLDYHKDSQSISNGPNGIEYEVKLINHPVELKEPLKFKFAVQVSPAKPFPKNRRAMEWGAQKRLHDTGGYGYWGNGIDSITPGSDERYTLLKQGLDKWRQDDTARKRWSNEKFVPMVLYNSGELLGQGMEEYETFSGEWCGDTPASADTEYIDTDVHTTINYRGLKQDWRSQPKRLGATKADLTDSCVDCRIWYYKKNMDKLGVDGYWFDNASLWPGWNPSTGRAYRTPEGKVRPGYPTFARHELFRRLFVLYKEAGKEPFFLLNGHTSFCFSPWRWFLEGPAYIYKHNGTIFDTLERNREYDIISRLVGAEKVERDPIAAHRGIIRLKRFMGSWNPSGCKGSRKGTRSIIALSLLHDFGIEFRIDNHEEMKSMLEQVGFFKPELEYLPYWRNQKYIEVKPDSVKCSLYHNSAAGTVLSVLVNPTKKDIDATAILDLSKLGLDQVEFSDPEKLGGLAGTRKGDLLTLKLTIPASEYRLVFCEDLNKKSKK